MLEFLLSILAAISVFFRSRSDLALEVLALRQQVAVLKRKRPRPTLNSRDRLFWTILRRAWPGWAESAHFQMRKAGVDVQTRRDMMGHETTSMDDRYTMIDDEALDEARREMGRSKRAAVLIGDDSESRIELLRAGQAEKRPPLIPSLTLICATMRYHLRCHAKKKPPRGAAYCLQLTDSTGADEKT